MIKIARPSSFFSRRIERWFLVLSLFTIVAGCGYTTRSMLSSKYRSIYVVPIVNKIDITNEVYTGSKYRLYRPLLETDITRAVVDKFVFDGNLKMATEANADLILRGELTQFRKDPLRYDENDEVTEYRVNVAVNLFLWDKKEDKVVWEEPGFTGDYSYFVTGPQAKSESAAINESIKDLARRIVERTVEDW